MNMRTKLVAGLAAVAISSLMVHAGGLFPGFPIVNGPSYCSSVNQPGGPGTPTQCTNQVPAGPAITGNEYVPADLQSPASNVNVAPSTGLLASAQLGGATWGTPRNYLSNGALNVTNTNGTSTVTCATTSAATVAALSADRWMCDANVTSGAGRTAIVTASPAPPAGFLNSMKVFRTSGALTQPICVWQTVPASRSAALAGQTVSLSANVAALAGLAADNGGLANLVIIAGTGTDEGLNASWTASPAITPAWTGISTVVSTQISLSTTFARFFTTATIPTTATEIGVGLCFTPTATGAGATDGFAFTGVQLERSPAPSLFEQRIKAEEQLEAQTYFYKIAEGAATTVRAMCMASTTTLAICGLQFPVTMYKAPTMSYTNGFATATTTAGSTLGACTTLRTSTLVAGNAASANNVMLDCVAATVPAAGSADYLADNGGSGVINAWTGL